MSAVLAAVEPLDRVRRTAALAALALVPLCGLCVLLSPGESARAYLVAFTFWFALAGGALGLLMLHQLVGGDWGRGIRPLMASAASTLPLMALLFLPLALALGRVYPWMDAAHVAADPVLQHKAAYLNAGAFLLRAAGYFAIWLLTWASLVWLWRRAARAAAAPPRGIQAVSAVGLLLYVLTMTFASIDWVMSLEPHWISSIFGLSFVSGQVLQTMALAVLLFAWFAERGQTVESSPALAGVLRDLGNLLLAFLLLWGYLAFSQYLIIWSGNLPEEIGYYVRRDGGWRMLAWMLIVGHFFVPFLLLLHRETKLRPRRLAAVAGFVLVMRLLDVLWLIEPSFARERLVFYVIDAAMLLAVGCLWTFWFTTALRSKLPLSNEAGAGS